MSSVFQASEVVSGSTVGTDLTSFSVMQVNITIQDQNDNAPEFNQDNYQVTIPEDMLDRTPLSTPIIEVTDRDQVPTFYIAFRNKEYACYIFYVHHLKLRFITI